MSRTYRRKNARKVSFSRLSFTPKGVYRLWDGDYQYRYMNEWFDHYPTEDEMKKTRNHFYSDAGTTSFKEPGPSWFRRMFDTRPGRRYNKRELQRYMLDENYEPMCVGKGKLDYWT